MTVVQLKTLCRERGLRVSGNKDEVIIRLMENDEASNIFQTQASAPAPQPMQMYQTQPIGGYVQPQYIQVRSQNEEMSKTIGTFVIFYAFSDYFGPWYSPLASEAAQVLGSSQYLHSLLELVSSLVGQYFTKDTATVFTSH